MATPTTKLFAVDVPDPQRFAFNAANTLLAVGGRDDGRSVVLDLADGRQVARAEGICPEQFEFVEDQLLALRAGRCALFDPRRGEFETLFAPPSHPSCATVDPTGRLLAVGVNQGLILYDLHRREVRQRLETSVDGAPLRPAFSSGGRYIAADFITEAYGDFLIVWGTEDGKRWRTIEIVSQSEPVVAFRGDSLAFALGQNGLRLYEPDQGDEPVASYPRPAYPSAVAFRDQGKTLVAVGYLDGLVEIDTATGRERRVVDRPDGKEVGHSEPSPDWSLVASRVDGGVLVWPSGLESGAGRVPVSR